MSTLIVKVCEECGAQAVRTDAWLVMTKLEVKSSRGARELVSIDEEVDLCSQGCLLRYVAKATEGAHQKYDSGYDEVVGRAASM